MEYTNGEKTGLNKYETKVSWNITREVWKFGMGSERSEAEQVMTIGIGESGSVNGEFEYGKDNGDCLDVQC